MALEQHVYFLRLFHALKNSAEEATSLLLCKFDTDTKSLICQWPLSKSMVGSDDIFERRPREEEDEKEEEEEKT